MTLVNAPFYFSPYEQNIQQKLNVNFDYYSNFLGSMDGWIEPKETWTYASATTFTVPGDISTRMSVGDKIRLTQTTVKYFYVTAVSYGSGVTTVTINGGSDYSLANAEITVPSYSKMLTPNGFPGYFNWTPGYTGFSVNPTVDFCRFSISGNIVTLMYETNTAGTSNAVGFTITGLPVAPTHVISKIQASVVDNTTNLNGVFSISGTTMTLFSSIAGAAWTAAGQKSITGFTFSYSF